MGASHIPRIGQEVMIDFEGGDPDLPICLGNVRNQLNRPVWRRFCRISVDQSSEVGRLHTFVIGKDGQGHGANLVI